MLIGTSRKHLNVNVKVNLISDGRLQKSGVWKQGGTELGQAQTTLTQKVPNGTQKYPKVPNSTQ